MKKFFISLAVIILTGISSFAQEGMWLLSQIDQLDLNQKEGASVPSFFFRYSIFDGRYSMVDIR